MQGSNKLAIAIAMAIGLSACKGGGEASDAVSQILNNDAQSIEQAANTSNAQDLALEDAVSPIGFTAKMTYVQPGVQIGSSTASVGQVPEIIHVEYAAFDGTKTPLFSDTATYLEIESYEINAKAFVKFEHNDHTLAVTNWIPRNIEDVLLVGEYDGKKYKLMHFDYLPGIETFEIELPWTMGATIFESLDGDIIDVSTIDTSSMRFSFEARSVLQKSIANINLDWNISFPDRVMNGKSDVCRDGNVVWRQTRPQDARYLLTFMVHAAQSVAHSKFHEFWLKTPFQSFDNERMSQEYILTADELETYSDKEKALYDLAALSDGKYYNKAHREMVYQKYFQKTFALGLTGGGGLGGGSTVGVNHNKIVEHAWTYGQTAAEAGARGDWFLPLDDKSYDQSPWNIFGHETGHALGFSHQQTYTVRSQYSHITVGTIVHAWLMANERTIVTADTMVGRDTDWEKPYNKKADADSRSRPRCGDAFEWGGAYEKHDFQMPQNDTPEWTAYIEAHLEGRGLEYLKELNISPAAYYDWWTP